MFKKIILSLFIVGNLYASIEDDVDAKRFEHKKGTLIDHFSGMQWQDNEDLELNSNRKSWEEAKNYCSNLVLDGKNDWRLPNIEELQYAYKIKNQYAQAYDYYSWSSTAKMNKVLLKLTAGAIRFTYSQGKIEYLLARYKYKFSIKCVRGMEYDSLQVLEEQIEKARKERIVKFYLPYYKKVKQDNTIKAYTDFVKKFPNAPQAMEALSQLFLLVKSQNNIQDYKWFAKEFPHSSQANKAKSYIYDSEFKDIQSENNIAAYEWFIKTYPKAPQVKEAIANTHKLAFDEAKDIDTISAYNTFIISYPRAKEVREANELAKELERYKYTDTLPAWFRNIMPNFLADIFNGIFGIFSNDEKKSRALLIKAKQIERQGNEYYGDKQAGYVMITNRMYDLLQEEYNDTDATLRFLESEEFKDFVKTFKRVMRSMNDRLDDISRYSSKILEVSKQGFSEANADRDMSEFYAKEHREWEKSMHLRDKGYE